MNFFITQKTKGPFYIYIHFKDFYVNHRKVLLSVDYDQLSGKILDEDDSKTNCEDYNKNKHLFDFYP